MREQGENIRSALSTELFIGLLKTIAIYRYGCHYRATVLGLNVHYMCCNPYVR